MDDEITNPTKPKISRAQWDYYFTMSKLNRTRELVVKHKLVLKRAKARIIKYENELKAIEHRADNDPNYGGYGND